MCRPMGGRERWGSHRTSTDDSAAQLAQCKALGGAGRTEPPMQDNWTVVEGDVGELRGSLIELCSEVRRPAGLGGALGQLDTVKESVQCNQQQADSQALAGVGSCRM